MGDVENNDLRLGLQPLRRVGEGERRRQSLGVPIRRSMNSTQVGDIRLADSALQPARIGRRNSRQTKVVPNTVIFRRVSRTHE